MSEREIDRREFLRSMLRSTAAASLTVGVGWLVMRKPSGDEPADCIKAIACGGCGEFGGCGLPRAIAARKRDLTTESTENTEKEQQRKEPQITQISQIRRDQSAKSA